MTIAFGDLDLLDAKYGHLLVPRHDPYISRSLREYGEFSESEVEIFREYVQPGDVVCDIGANIGAHTLALARIVGPTGAVFAFEPVLTIYWLLCANVALNHLYRVRPIHAALDASPGFIPVPIIPYDAQLNFGGLSLKDQEWKGESVRALTLDMLNLPPVQFLKLDVEHMEANVLRGAYNTITRDHPVISFEANTTAEAEASMDVLNPLGYRMMWHFAPLYNPTNIRGNHTNTVDLWSRNVLALPDGYTYPDNPWLCTKEEGDEAMAKVDARATARSEV